MDPGILMLFGKTPATLPLFEATEAKIIGAFPDAERKVRKTQVGYFNRYGFAWLWPPIRQVKGWPKHCIVLTFGLSYRLEHSRIHASVEASPSRWTHHVRIDTLDDLDDLVLSWLRESYMFSMTKGKGRP